MTTASGEPVIRLRHGTTRRRAEAILRDGPDIRFKEPHGLGIIAEGFSTARAGSENIDTPEVVAAGKARLFPDEGGPAIIEMDVPESIVRKAELGDEIRFEPGFGLEELLAAWPSISRRVHLL